MNFSFFVQKTRRAVWVLSAAALLGVFGSCATLPGGGDIDREDMDRVIATVRGLQQAVTWIAPVACTAIGIAAPEALPACQVGVAAAQALKAVTDEAVAAYEQDPGPRNADAVLSAMRDLEAAWRRLDAGYKGQPPPTAAPMSRIHPFRRSIGDRLRELIGPSAAWAADCVFSWRAVQGATGYELEYSADGGTTWTGRKSTGPLTPDAQGEVSWTYTGVPETGLLLFRVSAVNASGKAVRTESGAWYNHLWKPLGSPSGGAILNP